MTECLYDIAVSKGKIDFTSPVGFLFLMYKKMRYYQEFTKTAVLAKDISRDSFKELVHSLFPYMEKESKQKAEDMSKLVKEEQKRGPMVVTPMFQKQPKLWRRNAKCN